MSRSNFRLASGLLTLALAGCANSLESSWRDPATTQDSLRFRKILVVAMTRDGGMRRAAEDQLVQALMEGPRGKAGELSVTPSYVEVPDAKLGDVEQARAMVEARGYDGVVMLTPLSAQQKITVDAPMYTPMWGYYGRAGMLYDPGSVRSDTIVRVQTNIYSVKDGKLLWSGTSRTTNPRNVEGLVKDVVRDVVHELRDQGLLVPASSLAMRKLSIFLVVVAAAIGLYLFAAFQWNYSKGERAGWVQKLSKKGWLCKTWEGELAMVSLPGVVPEKFYFTVKDDEIAEQVNHLMGRRVTLHYEEKVGIPTTCFGDTNHWVRQVEAVNEIPLAPGVMVPTQPPAPPAGNPSPPNG